MCLTIICVFQIVDLEDGITQLKEDLIQERAEARVEKKRLKKSVVGCPFHVRSAHSLAFRKHLKTCIFRRHYLA